MKDNLVSRVIEILKEAGFILSKRSNAKSFDLAARRGEIILFIKVLHNIDVISEEIARSIKRLAFCLLASPIIIGERKASFFLENDVVYHRYGIPAINAHTLYDYFVEGVHPYVYAAPGGLYVNIDEEAMREAREREGMSVGTIAFELGVSRRSISKYEEEGMGTTIDIALKMEKILATTLIEPLQFLKREFEIDLNVVEEAPSSFEKYILGMIKKIGFEIFTTAHAPFSAVSEPQDEGIKILTGISNSTKKMIKKVKIVSSLSHVTKTKSVFVVDGNVKHLYIDNTALIKRDELKKIRDPEEFTSVMEERVKGGV